MSDETVSNAKGASNDGMTSRAATEPAEPAESAGLVEPAELTEMVKQAGQQLSLKANPILKANPSLADIQKYIAQMESVRGFSGETILHKCLLLGEEVGELMKAIRKHENIKIDQSSKVSHVPEEVADVLIMLLTIANRCGVDVESAFREKEEINKKRVWS
jgi:NTP pyrophosphatase (non-canonical NTP hydrolase)